MATEAIRDEVLDQILSGTDYTTAAVTHMSLHTADPTDAGTSEVTGGSYARQAISFNAAASGSADNDALISFGGPAASSTITYVGLWTAVSGGTFIWAGPMTTSKTFEDGDTLEFVAGAVVASTTAT